MFRPVMSAMTGAGSSAASVPTAVLRAAWVVMPWRLSPVQRWAWLVGRVGSLPGNSHWMVRRGGSGWWRGWAGTSGHRMRSPGQVAARMARWTHSAEAWRERLLRTLLHVEHAGTPWDVISKGCGVDVGFLPGTDASRTALGRAPMQGEFRQVRAFVTASVKWRVVFGVCPASQV